MTTLYLKYSKRKHAFRCLGTDLWFGPAMPSEFEDVAGWLARMLCDNPSAQAAVGVLGAESFEIEQAA